MTPRPDAPFGPEHPEWCPVGNPDEGSNHAHCGHWYECEPCHRCGDDTPDPNCDCDRCTAARSTPAPSPSQPEPGRCSEGGPVCPTLTSCDSAGRCLDATPPAPPAVPGDRPDTPEVEFPDHDTGWEVHEPPGRYVVLRRADADALNEEHALDDDPFPLPDVLDRLDTALRLCVANIEETGEWGIEALHASRSALDLRDAQPAHPAPDGEATT